MKEWTTVDKTGWPDGPWLKEPDKMVWVDEATDLDCMIHRGPSGALCGYVGVGPDHPWHGLHYDNVDAEVHGGLTYANPCEEEATEGDGLCHVPEPGRAHDMWWLGFDCAHAFDFMPKMRMDELKMADQFDADGKPEEAELFRKGAFSYDHSSIFRNTYKTITYVKAEVESLAKQASEAPRPKAISS
jgi:hypothetical protein